MLTPQEISDKRFDKVMVWGYDMSAVDNFLENVERDYSALYQENIVLKSKMKVLVQKIEEYRKVDDSMRKTLLNAQSIADDIVAKAKRESDSYEQNVKTRLTERLTGLAEEVAAEERRLEEAKLAARVYIDRILSLYAVEEERLSKLRQQEFPGVPFTRNTEDASPAKPAPKNTPTTVPTQPAPKNTSTAVPTRPASEKVHTAVVPETVRPSPASVVASAPSASDESFDTDLSSEKPEESVTEKTPSSAAASSDIAAESVTEKPVLQEVVPPEENEPDDFEEDFDEDLPETVEIPVFDMSASPKVKNASEDAHPSFPKMQFSDSQQTSDEN